MNSSSPGPHPLLFRGGRWLPFLLGTLSLFLIAGTCFIIFVQLPWIQEAVRKMIGQIMSELVTLHKLPSGMEITYPGSEIGVIMFPVSLACFACWLLLIYRLAWDARRTAGNLMQPSPAKCVLCFILPVGNLWMPVKALLNINSILSPTSRTPGKVLIWTAWALSVPVTLLTLLYTLIHPFIMFMETFGGWQEEADSFPMEPVVQDIQSLFSAMLGPVLFYNGIVFMLSLLASNLMIYYLDTRSRGVHPPCN